MPSANEICCLYAVTLAKKIRNKELSPIEVADAVLERIQKLDPTLHAFSTLAANQARQDASGRTVGCNYLEGNRSLTPSSAALFRR